MIRFLNDGFPRGRGLFVIGLAIYAAAQAIFLIYIQFPGKLNFDELHYVPAARQELHHVYGLNWEHPPLAKFFIAAGIAVGGDRPFGWRLASTVAGALTLAGVFACGTLLLGSVEAAAFAAWVTFANQLLYVQSRIALLDTFMACALIWSAFFFLLGARAEPRKFWWISGTLLGAAIACKWSAVAAIPLFCGFGGARRKPGTRGTWPLRLGAFLILPAVIYFAAFLPLYRLKGFEPSFAGLFRLQVSMYEGLKQNAVFHTYESHWYQWLIPTKPIWYYFTPESDPAWTRGVLLLGNPLVMVPGILAVCACAFRAETRGIAAFYLIFTLCWAATTRRVNFYYYYYPASFALSWALAAAWYRLPRTAAALWPVVAWGVLRALCPQRWEISDRACLSALGAAIGLSLWLMSSPPAAWTRWMSSPQSLRRQRIAYAVLCLGMFIYFLPILSGWKIPTESFRKWMWLSSWI